MNQLYFGDNLAVLREHVADASVDLVYLDPPFNSKENYSLIYKSPTGTGVDAQVRAFKDMWHWEEDAASLAMDEIRARDVQLFRIMLAFQASLGEGDMMAYLAMMAVRLLELKRVMKPTASLYLHCDPTASHYLKVILDAIFGRKAFRSEICWERTNAHNLKSRGWAKSHDVLLYYSNSKKPTFNTQYSKYGAAQLGRYKKDADGRLFKGENLTFSNPNPDRQFEWRGTKPPAHRSWGASLEQLEAWYEEGRILLKRDGSPRMDGLKVYLDDMPGKPVGSVWTDIDRIGNTSGERLGYQTQKPVDLLKRIILASSNPGDVVLDPFCGCGTTIHAAEVLGRKWIGIDVAYAAIQVIADRLSEWLPAAKYRVDGIPTAETEARALAAIDPHTFQQWAVGRLGGQPRGKGADRGIDGEIIFLRGVRDYGRAVVSVKAGQNVNPGMVRDLVGVVRREEADLGVFVCLRASKEMKIEASRSDLVELPGGKRPRIQIVEVDDLIRGADLGILTQLNSLQAAQAARAVRKPRRPMPAAPQNQRPLPPMGIMGGKKVQPPLEMGEPLMVVAPEIKRRRRR